MNVSGCSGLKILLDFPIYSAVSKCFQIDNGDLIALVIGLIPHSSSAFSLLSIFPF